MTSSRGDVSPPTGRELTLLSRLGFAELTHDSHVPFVSHLLGTRRLLMHWGERRALCDAGLFHSVYGTEYFQPDELADRAEVRELVGDEAEEIAWVWCTLRRDSIELSDPCRAVNRKSGATLTLGEQMIGDIATLWAADTVEQIARMSVDERRFAHGLGRIVHRASPPARAAVQSIMSLVAER
jgi:hypothetical protein